VTISLSWGENRSRGVIKNNNNNNNRLLPGSGSWSEFWSRIGSQEARFMRIRICNTCWKHLLDPDDPSTEQLQCLPSTVIPLTPEKENCGRLLGIFGKLLATYCQIGLMFSSVFLMSGRTIEKIPTFKCTASRDLLLTTSLGSRRHA
jgi:hypothetical protein